MTVGFYRLNLGTTAITIQPRTFKACVKEEEPMSL